MPHLPAVSRPRPRWWVQVLLLVGFQQAYDATRSLHGNVVAVAVRHGREILALDSELHVAVGTPLNAWLSHHDPIADLLTGYYVVMHFGMTSLTLVLLWLQGRHYRRQRNALLLASLVGLAVYWEFPCAPPRLLGGPFHDTVARVLPLAYRVEAHSANLYAAVPSLHMAWAVWVGVALWTMSARWWVRAVAVAHPMVTALTVLATGNHYTLDVVSGAVLTAVSYPLLAVLEWAWARVRDAVRSVARTRRVRPQYRPVELCGVTRRGDRGAAAAAPPARRGRARP